MAARPLSLRLDQAAHAVPIKGWHTGYRQNYAMARFSTSAGLLHALLPWDAALALQDSSQDASLSAFPVPWCKNSVDVLSPYSLFLMARDHFRGSRQVTAAGPVHPAYAPYFYPGTEFVTGALYLPHGAVAALVEAPLLQLHTVTGTHSPRLLLCGWIPFAQWTSQMPLSTLRSTQKEMVKLCQAQGLSNTEIKAKLAPFEESQSRFVLGTNRLRKRLDEANLRSHNTNSGRGGHKRRRTSEDEEQDPYMLELERQAAEEVRLEEEAERAAEEEEARQRLLETLPLPRMGDNRFVIMPNTPRNQPPPATPDAFLLEQDFTDPFLNFEENLPQ